MNRISAITAGLMSVGACCVLAASAFGQGYVPPLLDRIETYSLPSGHEWFFPAMAAYSASSLPWRTDLPTRYTGTPYVGKWLAYFSGPSVAPFDFIVSNGPSYSPPAPVASVQLIQYSTTGCAPAYRVTPQDPPTFSDAKAAADASCAALCGSGFEMTDFDMNQWKVVCYNYAGKSYNVATWGGTRCEKTTDNGLLQACNPVTGLVTIRQNLGGPLANCSDCDKDGDGQITLKDLLIERNRVYGSRKQGVGETRSVVLGTDKPIDQVLDIPTYVDPNNFISTDVDQYEITEWEAGTPVECTNTSVERDCLRDILKSNRTYTSYINQNRANGWCQLRGWQKCETGALGSAVGHCQIRKDGLHVVRVTGGYCMKCVN